MASAAMNKPLISWITCLVIFVNVSTILVNCQTRQRTRIVLLGNCFGFTGENETCSLEANTDICDYKFKRIEGLNRMIPDFVCKKSMKGCKQLRQKIPLSSFQNELTVEYINIGCYMSERDRKNIRAKKNAFYQKDSNETPMALQRDSNESTSLRKFRRGKRFPKKTTE